MLQKPLNKTKSQSLCDIQFHEYENEDYQVSVNSKNFNHKNRISEIREHLELQEKDLPRKLAEIALFLLLGFDMRLIEMPDKEMGLAYEVKEISTPCWDRENHTLKFYASRSGVPYIVEIQNIVKDAIFTPLPSVRFYS